jgi:saccharopine dehydrogenase-like NADP-dependent oxidoreductase
MPTIHWLGAGLSSAPGIRRLAAGSTPLTLWNRSIEKAESIVAGMASPPPTRPLEMSVLRESIAAGDVVISMLPGTMHYDIARMALDKAAHFVSSSYIADDMRELHGEAAAAGLCLINEVGLDPGLDHLMAHSLVDKYRNSPEFSDNHSLKFRSYCGGFPKVPNAFRYKFSWSPLGVLKALLSPARCISDGRESSSQRPWQALSEYRARLPCGTESFQAYPNRDSLPFIEAYQFQPRWQVDEFVRGTLRLPGWSTAWADLFEEIDALNGAEGEQRLQAISDELWRTQSYREGEQDRVVLCVELEALKQGETVWHQGYAVDAVGDGKDSAMARLVSYTVSLAVESVLGGRIAPGVSAAPSEPHIVSSWLSALDELGEEIVWQDYLAG